MFVSKIDFYCSIKYIMPKRKKKPLMCLWWILLIDFLLVIFFFKYLCTYSRILIFVTKIVYYYLLKISCLKEKTSNKSKAKKGFGAGVVKEPLGLA